MRRRTSFALLKAEGNPRQARRQSVNKNLVLEGVEVRRDLRLAES